MSKYKTLVHFIIHACQNHPERLGATRLNKVLWFSDVIAYQTEGRSITGETYVKRRHGPTPRAILPILRELEQDGAISIREPEFIYDSRLFYSMKSPVVDDLSLNEQRLVRTVLGDVLGHTALGISEKTHDSVWRAVKDGEVIPIEATLVAIEGDITPGMLEWADGVLADARNTAGT